MSLSWARALLHVGVHPLQTAQRCYEAVFTTGSGVMRETVDVLSALSHRSLHFAALAPSLLDVLHSPAAEEVAAAVVALVKSLHSLLQSDPVPVLLHQLLQLLRSPASREVVDAASAALLAVIRLCRTPQVERTSARLSQAIRAMHVQAASDPQLPSPLSAASERPLSHAQWMDCLTFLLHLSTADSRWSLSPGEVRNATERVRARDAGLALWWAETCAAREGGSGESSAVAHEASGYRLDGEGGEEMKDGRAADASDERCLQQLRQLLAE